MDRIGKDLIANSTKVLESLEPTKKRGKSVKRRPRSPKRKKKNKGEIEALSVSFLVADVNYPQLEQMFLQQTCDQRPSDLVRSRMQPSSFRKLSLDMYTYLYSLTEHKNGLYHNHLLNVGASIVDTNLVENSTVQFENLAKQLFVQLRAKFMEFAKSNQYVSDLDRQKPDMRLKHEHVIIFLKDYLKEFRPYTDLVISDLDQYVFHEKRAVQGNSSLFYNIMCI